MIRLVRVIVLGVVAVGLASLAVAEDKVVSVLPIDQDGATPVRLGQGGSSWDCQVGNLNGPEWWVGGLFWPNEDYKVVFDPTAACGACSPGFSVGTIHVLVVSLDSCTVSLSVDLSRADLLSPGCYLPGEVLCSSNVVQVRLPVANIWNISIPLNPQGLPGDCCYSILDGPYCVGFHLVGTSIPSGQVGPVLDSGPGELCRSWNDYGYGWIDLVGGLGLPGNLIVYADAVCCELPPQCKVSPTSLDFGSVVVGTYAEQDFTITNIGGGTLTGSVSENCGFYSIVSGGGDYSLTTGESRTVTVRFAPRATGALDCQIAAGIDCVAVECTGTGEPRYCTFPCWDWAADCLRGPNRDVSTVPACVLEQYFDDAFPSGLVVGGSGIGLHKAVWTSAAAVKAFACGYGLPATLDRDWVDPASNRLGSIYGEVVALRLNVEFSCQGYFTDCALCYGKAVVPPEVPRFAGLTVGDLLKVADRALSGDATALVPYGNSLLRLQSALAYMNDLYSDCGSLVVGPPIRHQVDDGDDPAVTEPKVLPRDIQVTSRPNPLLTDVTIRLGLPVAGNVSLEIYDVQGRRVVTMAARPMGEGYHDVTWNGADDSGSPVASGVYFLRVQVDGQTAVMHKLTKL